MMQVHEISGEKMGDAFLQVFPQQAVCRLLTGARFEFGFRRSDLRPYDYAAGDMILSRREGEKWIRWNGPVRMLALNISDEAFQSVADESGGGVPSLAGDSLLEDARVKALFTAVEAERAAGFVSGQIFLDSMAQAFAATLMSKYGFLRKQFSRGGLSPQRLRRVIECMHASLDKQLTLRDLSACAGLSSSHFSHQFRISTGTTPHKYLLRLRVERCKDLLREEKMSILEAALETGFQTQQHLATAFRRVVGASPSAYRRAL